MTEPLSAAGPWKLACPKCKASSTVNLRPDRELFCTLCLLDGHGSIRVIVEEVPRGLPN
jgi:hypothetical protein